MLYLANPCSPKVRDAMRAWRTSHLGFIATPAQGNRLIPGVPTCFDNGIYGDAYPGDEEFLEYLARHLQTAPRALFAVAPDVVADAAATLERSGPMLSRIRRLGIPVALAAQDGLEELAVPWNEFDVLFLAGSTEWKLGPAARDLAQQARARGKRVHMGRANSLRRLRYAAAIGCNTADGTYLAYGPDANLPRLLGWLRDVNRQLSIEVF